MDIPKYKIALIVGAGAGLSASLTRLFSREGIRVALGARSIEKLGALCTETGAPRLCLRYHQGRGCRTAFWSGRARDRNT
ncbi:NADP-dependent 3-hydroxy acid dehydrogenase YdfG [Bradyrhizobium elkanii]